MSNVPVDTALEVTPAAAPIVVRAGAKPRRRFVFVRNGKSVTGLAILGVFVVLAVVGPWIAPYDPSKVGVGTLLAHPSAQHLLGTDHIGRDVFSQLLVGTRGVMVVGVLAAVIATLLAIAVGVTAGFLGGAGDEVLSAVSNIFLVIPALPLIILVAAAVRSTSNLTIALVLAGTGWAWGARLLRAQTLSLRRRDFVEAARASGERTWRIVWFETLPNLTAIIASSFISTMTFAVLSQTTLAFIGVANVNDWSWGTVLYWAQGNQALARGAWWWFVPAGVLIAVLGMALSLVNFGIDEFVNPRLRLAGLKPREMRKRGIRPRIGFTATVRDLPRRPEATR
ncbi:MAG: peptide ABC transporter permease [Cellulomonas sp. 73-92]|uniref:ABC transporter permease n=1 Tax=Cellulomonas sp. 73-92 TaxID=1895740 RepID=UPI000925AC5F|nr:ABC transporter permease [Cellulomonas sp. 73-92]OJV80805.1 MAG: peptide ABC transporter permease [Cellulomonas sp. 73-92]